MDLPLLIFSSTVVVVVVVAEVDGDGAVVVAVVLLLLLVVVVVVAVTATATVVLADSVFSLFSFSTSPNASDVDDDVRDDEGDDDETDDELDNDEPNCSGGVGDDGDETAVVTVPDERTEFAIALLGVDGGADVVVVGVNDTARAGRPILTSTSSSLPKIFLSAPSGVRITSCKSSGADWFRT